MGKQIFIELTLGLVLVLAISGCATKAYKEAKGACTVEGYRLFPANIEHYTGQCTREVKVPTGILNCHTQHDDFYNSSTSCTQKYRTEYETYTCPKTRDLNETQRDNYIHQCATARCYQTHGNSDCK